MKISKKAFTLVELLVVISIIALLLSILMPSLGRAREQAKKVGCQSNLKQLGLVAMVYAQDYKGSFSEGIQQFAGYPRSGSWNFAYESYYSNPKLRFCPNAMNGLMSAIISPGAKFTWSLWNGLSGQQLKSHEGSYGANHWIYNCPSSWQTQSGAPTAWNWRKIDSVGRAKDVPMILDCWYVGGSPLLYESPPEEDGLLDRTGVNAMNRFCISRHSGYQINAVFVDTSVRSVGLKQLWKLKWHREFNTKGWGGLWPAWMKKLKE